METQNETAVQQVHPEEPAPAAHPIGADVQSTAESAIEATVHAVTGAPAPAEEPVKKEALFSERELDFTVRSSDAKAGVMGNLENRRFLVQDTDRPGEGYYCIGYPQYTPDEGYVGNERFTNDRNKARIYTWAQVQRLNSSILEVLKDGPSAPMPEGQKSKLEQHFNAKFIELMRMAPKAEMVLGHIAKKFKQAPPSGLDTFDQLKHWIEFTFDYSAPVSSLPISPVTGRARRQEPQFEIELEASERRYGTARYRVNITASLTERVDLSEIKDWIEDGKGEDEIMDAMLSNADFSESDWDEGEYYYSDHEESNSDSWDSSIINPVGAARALRSFLEQHAPEHLDMLDNN